MRIRRRAWMLRIAASEFAEALWTAAYAAETLGAALLVRTPPCARDGVDDRKIVSWRGRVWTRRR
jgi:hypothetical protein